MRRLIAIMLLFVLLFYHAGYYGFYINALYQLESSWNLKIEKGDLPENRLHTKSIFISFPYLPDQQDFHPVSEKLELEGKFYRVVKQKYAQDTLHIVYINDVEREQLKLSFNDWIQTITQKPVSKEGKQIILTNLTKNYLPIQFDCSFSSLFTFNLINIKNYSFSVKSPFLKIPTPPPQVS
jgi:hypothetical protein